MHKLTVNDQTERESMGNGESRTLITHRFFPGQGQRHDARGAQAAHGPPRRAYCLQQVINTYLIKKTTTIATYLLRGASVLIFLVALFQRSSIFSKTKRP